MKRIKNIIIVCLCLMVMSAGAETRLTPPPSIPVLEVTTNGTLSSTYMNGTMRLMDTDGSLVEMPAKFKTRGASTVVYDMKPSFNMKLRSVDYSQEKDSALLGMRSCSSWIVDAMAIDRICMRNRVAFDIWNDFSRLPYDTKFEGRNGTEGRFVEVYINNEYYGIYCLTDRINRKLLDLNKTQENANGSVTIKGVLYKNGTQDIENQNEPCYNADSSACVIVWHDAWELTYPEDHGGQVAWAPLQEAYAQGQTLAYVKKHFYIENLIDYQIHVMALSIGDNWGTKNHFLSVRDITKSINDPLQEEADKRRFVLTPWDLDTSLGGYYDGSCYDGNYSNWPVSAITANAFYPIRVVYLNNEYNTLLRQRWLVARSGAFSTDSINAKLERYRDLFINSGAWQRMVEHYEQKSSKPCYVTDLAKEIRLIEQWYANRFREMDEYFNVPASIDNQQEERNIGAKRLVDGQLIIVRGDEEYNVLGVRVK